MSGFLILKGIPIMTVLGPSFIALQVHDLQASARFYEEMLGLTRAPASPPGAVVFETHPVPFAVREPLVDLDAVDKLGWGVALWLKAEDAEKTHDDLVEHGVRIVTPPFDGPFGRTFAFADPDGYVVTLHS
jgi:predicted enzyme related to lactoylglutathione lyase